MFPPHVARTLELLEQNPGWRVLDVGGWACPFNRADWVLDAEPYETRGYYAKIGMPASQGGTKEHFTKETWVQRDICAREPWPFADKSFDFAICSHTLEDVRDPLFVCSELVRVARRGYIETPSRTLESCRGQESRRIAGLSHHRWLVEIAGSHVQFTMKYHLIHEHFALSLPPSFARKLSPAERIVSLFWENGFTFAETTLHGPAQRESLRQFVAERHRYARWRYWLRSSTDLASRVGAALRRRSPF